MMDLIESQKVINSYTFRVARRLQAAGAPAHLIEDVKQECWIAWCNARDTYDEASPASFKTYLWGGLRIHMNNWIRKHINARFQEVIAQSMDAEIGEEGSSTLGDVIPSVDPTPDEEVERESSWRDAVSKLKPRTRQFIELLRDPPQALLEQVRQLEARSSYARQNGAVIPFANRVTTTMVFDLMEATRIERTTITSEIKSLGKRLEARR